MPGKRHRWRGDHAQQGTWFLEPTLLLLLHHGSAHGYPLVDRLRAFGLQDLHPSIVYRALRDMDEQGLVRSSWEMDETQGPPRRVYSLTDLGDKALKTYMQELQQTHAQIANLMAVYDRHMKEDQGEYH